MDEAQIEQLFGMLEPNVQEVVRANLKPREYYIQQREAEDDIRGESLGTTGFAPTLFDKYCKIRKKVEEHFEDHDNTQYHLAMAYLCAHIGVDD